MKENIIITIGGGSRGIGKSLLDIFGSNGFSRAAFHRSAEIADIKNFFFDIDLENSISKLTKELEDFIENSDFDKYTIQFISGGSLGVDFTNNNHNFFERVLKHNLVVPASITSSLFNFAEVNQLKNIDLFYYSSAVVENLNASPYYVSAKSGLESFFKSSFLKRPENIKMFLIRLGYVDIEYKYFHKLSKTNPMEFQKMVLDNLPSKHFSKTSEISNLSYYMSKEGEFMNGSICDLTGGHSWK